MIWRRDVDEEENRTRDIANGIQNGCERKIVSGIGNSTIIYLKPSGISIITILKKSGSN